MGPALAGKSASARQKERDSLILARFNVFVRQSSCEDDLILIRNKTSAVSTPRSAPKNKRTDSRCIFCAARKRSRKCLAIRFTAVRQQRSARRANSRRKRSVALQNAVRGQPARAEPLAGKRHDAGGGVRLFFRSRFSNTPRSPAQNRPVAPGSSDRQFLQERICRLRSRSGSSGIRRRKFLDKAK